MLYINKFLTSHLPANNPEPEDRKEFEGFAISI
jgi:hypothetical protein